MPPIADNHNSAQETELKAIFDQFDTDGSGGIDHQELRSALFSLGIPMSDAEVDAAFAKMDTSSSSIILFEDFRKWVSAKVKLDSMSQIFEIFKIIDTNNDGELSREELLATFEILNLGLTAADVDKIISATDKNGDKMIQLDEFAQASGEIWSKVKITLAVAHTCKEILTQYTLLAEKPEAGFGTGTNLPYGKENAANMGYDVSMLPDDVWKSSCMCGNPFSFGVLKEGDTVIDFGCGAGADACVSGKLVGPTGRVYGVDMTPAMIEKARANAKLCGLPNVEFILGVFDRGLSPKIPVGVADVVVFNGSFNLSSRKKCALVQAFNSLKLGGELHFVDVVKVECDHAEAKSGDWCDCVAGALPIENIVSMMKSVGFTDVNHLGFTGYDTSPSTKSAMIIAKKAQL